MKPMEGDSEEMRGSARKEVYKLLHSFNTSLNLSTP